MILESGSGAQPSIAVATAMHHGYYHCGKVCHAMICHGHDHDHGMTCHSNGMAWHGTWPMPQPSHGHGHGHGHDLNLGMACVCMCVQGGTCRSSSSVCMCAGWHLTLSMHACMLVCVCIRACMQACVHVCMRSSTGRARLCVCVSARVCVCVPNNYLAE